jgi:hypothetical protein
VTTRTNLVTNPSLEVNATGWQSNSAFGGYDVATVARSTARGWRGSASLQITAPAAVVGETWGNITSTPVVVGKVYTFSAYVWCANDAVAWADAVFMERGPVVDIPASTWTRVSVTFVANADHVFAGVGAEFVTTGFTYFIDSALLEEAYNLDGYFDGSTTDTADVTYAWTGTAHASTSTAVSPDPEAPARLSAVDALRLEVQTDPEPGQLVNLVENPTGELGGYGWNTPIAGSVLDGFFDVVDQRWVLRYIGSQNAGGSYFRTESMPMSAGQYVAARWRYVESSAGVYRARISFLDANQSVISSTTYFSYNSSTDDVDANIGPYLAPANTVFVRLAFEVGDPGGTYPISLRQAHLRITNVTVAVAATSAELGTSRTNVIANPSAETNTSGWTGINSTLTRGTVFSVPVVGSAYFRLEKTSSGQGIHLQESAVGSSAHVVAAGQTWRIAAALRASNVAAGSYFGIQVYWSNASGSNLGGGWKNIATVDMTALDTWHDIDTTVQVPTSTSRMALRFYVVGPGGAVVPTGGLLAVDAIIAERYNGTTSVGYFDGSTTASGGWSYAWTGTTNNSASTATTSNLAFVEPVPYADVLGDIRELSVVREELNVGTLSATVVNPDLSPAIAETLRPGRKFRLMLNPDPASSDISPLAFGGWTEPLITGKLDNAKVEYRPLENNPARRAIITLTAVDPIALLANAKRPNTVGTVEELPYVIEGAGVPWRTNGSSSQIASADVVVENDGASALDQVAITRDTVGGYAWVDRFGVLRVYSVLPGVEVQQINNGTFTSGFDPWLPLFANLTSTAPPSPLSGNAAQLQPHGDSSSAVLIQGNPLWDGTVLRVAGGQEIEATAWVRSNVSRLCTLYFQFFDKDDNVISAIYNSVGEATATSTSAWQERTRSFTVPAGAYRMAVQVAFIHASGSNLPTTDRHWVDNVSYQVVQPLVPDLDETVYNHNFVVDYDTDRAINSVEIHRQWTHPAEGPQETVYGPYTDAESVSEWGTKHASVTVAGTAVADIPDLAAAILEKNATPEVRVQSLQIPINRDTLQYATLDLYDLVHVTNEAVGVDAHMRVTGITHSIAANPTPGSSDRWLMTINFASENAIATPTEAPALPGSTADSELYVDMEKNGSAQSITNGVPTVVSGWTVNANVGGGTLAGSSKVITTPGLHAISGTATFVASAGTTTTRRLLMIQVNGVDVARQEVETGDIVSLHASNTVFVDAGDTVQMAVYQNSGGSLNIDGAANRSHFTVVRLGG